MGWLFSGRLRPLFFDAHSTASNTGNLGDLRELFSPSGILQPSRDGSLRVQHDEATIYYTVLMSVSQTIDSVTEMLSEVTTAYCVRAPHEISMWFNSGGPTAVP